MSSSVSWAGNRAVSPGTSCQNPVINAAVQQTGNGTTTQTRSVQPQPTADRGTLQGPPPSTEKGYIPNYLESNIGRNVRAEFIIGTSQYADKTGILKEVGINYFVLHDVNSRTDFMCDLYSVKFVTMLLDS